jgi:hypothetical protein
VIFDRIRSLGDIKRLTDESVVAAIRENERIANVRSGATEPDAQAVYDYHRIRTILLSRVMGVPDNPFARMFDATGGTTDADIAAVERHREEILRADPELAAMLARTDAALRQFTGVQPAPKPRARRGNAKAEEPIDASRRTVISYSIPRGIRQVFREKTLAKAWERFERFMRACTDGDPRRPTSATLQFAEGARIAAEPKMLGALERVRAALGPSRAQAWSGLGLLVPEMAAGSPNLLMSGGVRHTWEITDSNIDAALELMFAGEPWPRTMTPVTLLTIMHQFAWTDTGGPTAEHERSMCFTTLAGRCTFAPHYVFPFEAADDRFLAYLGRIKDLVPTPLSFKHFRTAHPTKTGTLVHRKFDTTAIASVLAK